ncbi:PspC domain-containing protein [Brucepastera parasyntrophica]|uniref:PspC domain-containing protein n=1 Tax=Brucepastera parasyntrophica TaxID=2880008 RepID=UPI00210E5463|nr:PspC domain-containing protein [Brucepastera parasyntrophica]ULQ58966.1 PspC domain-containing protein [Brucepastera parasyntrophica]
MAKTLYRLQEGKIFLGVCAGFAEYFDVDVTLMRIIWVFFALIFGAGILVYFIAAFLMPKK